MSKVPKSPHSIPQLTTSELADFIDELKAALGRNLSDDEKKVVLGKLREAYLEQNHRAGEGAMGAPEITNPDVIRLLELPLWEAEPCPTRGLRRASGS